MGHARQPKQQRGPWTPAWVVALSIFVVAPAASWSAPGSAISFDGIDDLVVVADRDTFSPPVNTMTISFWAKIPTTATALGNGSCGSTGRYFIAKGNTNQWEWAVENDNNSKLCVNLWQLNSNNHGNVSISRTLNDGLWHHYAITLTYLTRLVLYLDGVQVASTTSFSKTMGNGTEPLRIGGRADGNNFWGILDEVRIEKRELTAAEIATQYNSTGQSGSSANLAASWHFDEGSGTTTADYSGNGATGTLLNGPTWVTGLVQLPATDTTAPTGTVTINSAAARTNSPNVTLALAATDNSGSVAQMQLSNNGTTFNAPEPYATSKSWTLTTGDGTKTVYVKFSDAAGNWSTPATATIILDATPPTGSVSINNGAASTTSTSVTLTLSATDALSPVAQMQFSNDGLTYSLPEAYATSKSWTLSTGDGTKTVSVKCSDAAGNWSTAATDTIWLATGGALTVTITSPADGAIFAAP